MTILPIGIAMIALSGFAAVWLRLQAIKKTVDNLVATTEPDDQHALRLQTLKRTVDHLEQIHESSQISKTVVLEEVSLPPFAFPDKVLDEPERLIVLGHRNLTIDLGNQPDGNEHGVIKNLVIETPPGTTHVVPSLRGFFLTFGSVIRNPEGAIVALNAQDHHLGYEALEITVVDVGNGTATLNVGGVLRDKNGDDSWSGTLLATALFLGPQL